MNGKNRMKAHGEHPIVTVIMPVYNAAKYVPAALDSILAQTFQDFEVVAVDDGATDDSAAVLEKYTARDPRIRVFHQKNAGSAAARNKAISLARGKYIAQHDADDLSMPARLERQMRTLDAHPDLTAVFCRSVMTDENLTPLLKICSPMTLRKIRKAFRFRNALPSDFMIRTEALVRIGGFREAFLLAHDSDLNLRILETGNVICLPEVLYIIRRHKQQVSSARESEQRLFGALARAFAVERKLRGRDSYEQFTKAGGLERFVRDYEFRDRFFLIAGERFLQSRRIPEARKYLEEAAKGPDTRLAAKLLLMKSHLPHVFLKGVESLKSRFWERRWKKRIPREVRSMLDGMEKE